MSNFFQKALVLTGSAALVAFVAVAPASAQGVPAGLLRLDPPQATTEGQVADLDHAHAKVRNAYARANRKVVAH